MQTFELLLLLVAAALGLTLIARALQVPSAVMHVLGGMALAFVPGLPALRLEPELVLALFLPPLLQASALRTDWSLFRDQILFIVLLAVGAVLFTAGVVAVTARELIPGLGWPAAIALGAIVAPPDAIAAASVLRRFKLPRRIVAVLEGESLINDASALVLYRLAVAAAVAGALQPGAVVASFALTAVIGVAIGLAAGRAANWLMQRLDDHFLEIVVSFLSAFLAYLVAEGAGGSGVLGAVACGGMIARAQHRLAARTRLQAHSAWELVEFLLSSLVFLLVGLQLRDILGRLGSYDSSTLLLLGGAVSGALIVSRFVWVFLTFSPASAITAVLRGGRFSPPLSYPAIISWSGMRGVVSLAAALALPLSFEGRDIIVYLAFCAIFATLVVQGTTLRLLIHWADPKELAENEHRSSETALHSVQRAIAAALGETVGFGDIPPSVPGDDDDRDALLRQRLVSITEARRRLAKFKDDVPGDQFAGLVRSLDLEEEQILLEMPDRSG